ncbi:hypothetical protein V1515DRAFT_591671 [Lipomyces mesembrius]
MGYIDLPRRDAAAANVYRSPSILCSHQRPETNDSLATAILSFSWDSIISLFNLSARYPINHPFFVYLNSTLQTAQIFSALWFQTLLTSVFLRSTCSATNSIMSTTPACPPLSPLDPLHPRSMQNSAMSMTSSFSSSSFFSRALSYTLCSEVTQANLSMHINNATDSSRGSICPRSKELHLASFISIDSGYVRHCLLPIQCGGLAVAVIPLIFLLRQWKRP